MAKTLKVGVSDLLTEFLADALILLCPLQTAGTITAGTLQAIFHDLYHFFVLIQPHCHINTSFRLYYTVFYPSVKGAHSSLLT